MIDLHMHSTYSDGTKTIEEILEIAQKQGLHQIAITDHNNIKGSLKAKELSPIDFVVGTELSVDYDGEEVHLLGYFPNGSNYKNVEFVIETGEIYKKLAIVEMVERLNEQGYNISVTELSDFTSGTINRVHICRALMRKGYIDSVAEGFDKLVGDHCKAYVKREYVSIKDACEAIHNDGGIAVIAHPYNYKHLKDIPKLLADINDVVDGIECFHPSATVQDSEYLTSYAKDHNKIITGGSDFHGDNKPTIFVGMMNVSDEYKIKSHQ